MNGGSLLFLVAMFVLLWALLIRPQKAKQQRQQRMLSDISAGDEVLTAGGIYGIVVGVDEDDDNDLIVEVAEGIHVRVARRGVADVVKPEEDDDDDADESSDAADEEEAEPAADVTVEDPDGLMTVPDEAASIEETQKRLEQG